MTTITLEGKEYQIDIQQAKELGLLKENDSRVRSWKEFIEKYKYVEGYAYHPITDDMLTQDSPLNTPNQLTQPEAKALAAFSKLIKLRRDWIGDWEPDWENTNTSYGVIWVNKNKIQANTACTLTRSLSFPDYKMAKEFLETFRDLIEEAKILI